MWIQRRGQPASQGCGWGQGVLYITIPSYQKNSILYDTFECYIMLYIFWAKRVYINAVYLLGEKGLYKCCIFIRRKRHIIVGI